MSQEPDRRLAACRAFLEKMGLGGVGVEWGMVTEYNRDENAIYLHAGQNERTAPHYVDFMRDKYGIELSAFHPTLAAFFHEAGHAATMATFPEDDLWAYFLLKDGATSEFYWSLPDEVAANKWVVAHWGRNEITELAAQWK